jgi:hypothetical protein
MEIKKVLISMKNPVFWKRIFAENAPKLLKKFAKNMNVGTFSSRVQDKAIVYPT